jgi:hypothetical protein
VLLFSTLFPRYSFSHFFSQCSFYRKRDVIVEQKALLSLQKEKQKRDMGQSSKGKNYAEEEKKLLRDQGIYSGLIFSYQNSL